MDDPDAVEPTEPIRAQLDRIEAKLDQLLASTGTVRFLKVYDWDTGSIERIREEGHERNHAGNDDKNSGQEIQTGDFLLPLWENSDFAGTMAAANHLLPDDDPGKITAADVFYIEEVEANLRAFVEAGHAGDFLKAGLIEYCDGAERSAAKLRAILPP